MKTAAAAFTVSALAGAAAYTLLIAQIPLETLLPTFSTHLQTLTEYLQKNWQVLTGAAAAVGTAVTLLWNKIHQIGIQKKQKEYEAQLQKVRTESLSFATENTQLKQQLDQALARLETYEKASQNMVQLQNANERLRAEVERLQREMQGMQTAYQNIIANLKQKTRTVVK